MDKIFELATLIVGVALVTLLINRSQGTAQVIGASTQGFNSILRTITLQNSGSSIGFFR